MNKSLIIGIGSHTKVGKTTFANLFKELLSAELPDREVVILSFATQLRKELNHWTIKEYNIDLYSCPPEEKELIRPIMAGHGKIKRFFSKGTHYTELLEHKIKTDYDIEHDNPIYIIDDFRYCSKVSGYENDEDVWIKKNGGVTVYLDRYDTIPENSYFDFTNKGYITPANDDERENSYVIKQCADYKLEWPTTNNKQERMKYVVEFYEWLRYNHYIDGKTQ
ncbi:MAG: hypothetical protein AABY22_26110 [Nanoarchaeota archaeon]